MIHTQVDYRKRIFILKRIEQRDSTLNDLEREMKYEFKDKSYSVETLRYTCERLKISGCLRRRKLDSSEKTDNSRNIYSITEAGVAKRKYYEKKLAEERNVPSS